MVEYEKIKYKIPVDIYQLNDDFYFQEDNRIFRINTTKDEVYHQTEKFIIIQTIDNYILLRTKDEIIFLKEIYLTFKVEKKISFHRKGSRQHAFLSNKQILFKEFTSEKTDLSIYDFCDGYLQTISINQEIQQAFIVNEKIIIVYEKSVQILTLNNEVIGEVDLSENLGGNMFTFSEIKNDFLYINIFYKDKSKSILFKISLTTYQVDKKYENFGIDLLMSGSRIFSIGRKTNRIAVLDVNTDYNFTYSLEELDESYIETQCKPRISENFLILCLQEKNSEYYNKWLLLDTKDCSTVYLEEMNNRIKKNDFFISQFYINPKKILIQANYEWHLYKR